MPLGTSCQEGVGEGSDGLQCTEPIPTRNFPVQFVQLFTSVIKILDASLAFRLPGMGDFLQM